MSTPWRRAPRRCCGANRETQVLVKADNAVAYGRVVQAMVMLQQAGARKIGFITEPLPPGASGDLMRTHRCRARVTAGFP